MTSRQSSQDLDRAFEFFNEIGIIAQLSGHELERNLPDGLNQSQFAVLNWFHRVDDQATPGRLARAFQVTPGAMTNTLGKLSAKGFVTIEPDPDSGRRKIVRITEAGRKARGRAIAASRAALESFLQAHPVAGLSAMLPELRAIRAHLDAARESR